MAELSSLKYPNKSHRKQVRLPALSVELAEFFGIMLGDGGINNLWQINISLNSVSDLAYSSFLSQKIKDLFGVSPTLHKNKCRQGIRLVVSSVSIVDFLVDKGLPRGNKLKNGLRIPEWILDNLQYRLACVRGLMDTDGCLYIHRHSVAGKEYKNIGLCFCSFSPEIIRQVSSIFEEFGIIPHISNQGRSIYLYKASAVADYLKIFGTSNERIRSIYREFGGVS